MFLDLKQKYSKLYIIWKVFLSRVQWFLLHLNPIVYKKVIAFRVFFDIREIWVKRVMIKCKVAGLVVKIEKNGLQILVQRKILHEWGHFVAIFGKKAMFGPLPNYRRDQSPTITSW